MYEAFSKTHPLETFKKFLRENIVKSITLIIYVAIATQNELAF